MPPDRGYTFGPFVLDVQHERLLRDAQPVPLSSRHIAILRLLVSSAGRVVTKESLIEAAWSDVAVGDNSLEQAISSLRRTLGSAPDGEPYIETLVRQGYRFRAPVVSVAVRQEDDVLAEALQPYRMFLEGRAAIETLGRDAVERARLAFAGVVQAEPDYAPGHIGLANALALEFDAARGAGRIDVSLLQGAVTHAREACRLDVGSGEAWATLAFVLSRVGGGVDAVAAGRRATSLESENWRHHVRLAYAAWGDERLRAARAAARRLVGFGLAHWLAATVHIARGALDEALRELSVGATAQDAQVEAGPFNSVGLHLLLGMTRLAAGDLAAAETSLRRELSFESAGHLYTPQACAAAWSALGAVHLARSEGAEAAEAWERALERVPGHAASLAALAHTSTGPRRTDFATRFERRVNDLERVGATVDAAVARAVLDVLEGRQREAATRVHTALRHAPAGSAGWSIPVEPLLYVTSHRDIWAPVLSLLALRAA